MKRILALLSVIAVALMGLTACSSTPAEAETIKIGVNVELTGEAAVYGTPEKLAAEMAVKEINDAGGVSGRPILLNPHPMQLN